jgi:hypothetical protein
VKDATAVIIYPVFNIPLKTDPITKGLENPGCGIEIDG